MSEKPYYFHYGYYYLLQHSAQAISPGCFRLGCSVHLNLLRLVHTLEGALPNRVVTTINLRSEPSVYKLCVIQTLSCLRTNIFVVEYLETV